MIKTETGRQLHIPREAGYDGEVFEFPSMKMDGMRHMDTRQDANIAIELALLAVLATLWGGSYTFIKLGVATIPPITLIAARTVIAGLLLLAVMRLRGI
ncbi:hypothetical protein E4T56_gene17972, partial [Termitomyces sp. T112]